VLPSSRVIPQHTALLRPEMTRTGPNVPLPSLRVIPQRAALLRPRMTRLSPGTPLPSLRGAERRRRSRAESRGSNLTPHVISSRRRRRRRSQAKPWGGNLLPAKAEIAHLHSLALPATQAPAASAGGASVSPHTCRLALYSVLGGVQASLALPRKRAPETASLGVTCPFAPR
jgi:hypothetical protein